MTKFLIEVNRNTVSKRVVCPHCKANLECYGYMIGANCNCRFCQKSFILTEETWNASYVIANDKCYYCNNVVDFRVLVVAKDHMILQCMYCSEKMRVNYDQDGNSMRDSLFLGQLAIDLFTGLDYELTCIEELKETIGITPRMNDLDLNEKEFTEIWVSYRLIKRPLERLTKEQRAKVFEMHSDSLVIVEYIKRLDSYLVVSSERENKRPLLLISADKSSIDISNMIDNVVKEEIKKITCSYPNCNAKKHGKADLCLKHLKEHSKITDWSIQKAKDAGIWKDDD